MAAIERFAPGESTPHQEPGDFILTHEDTDLFSRLIHIGQALRFRGKDRQYARWNHAAIFINGLGTIAEALSNGVTLNHISKYAPREYVVVHVEASYEDRMEAANFALCCLNDGYGWITILSITLSLLTGAKFSFGIDGEFICSGLVAASLERTKAIFPRSAVHMTPADLAKFYEVVLP